MSIANYFTHTSIYFFNDFIYLGFDLIIKYFLCLSPSVFVYSIYVFVETAGGRSGGYAYYIMVRYRHYS